MCNSTTNDHKTAQHACLLSTDSPLHVLLNLLVVSIIVPTARLNTQEEI